MEPGQLLLQHLPVTFVVMVLVGGVAGAAALVAGAGPRRASRCCR